MFPVGVMAADRKHDTKRPPRLLGRPFRITRWCSDGAAFERMVGVVSRADGWRGVSGHGGVLIVSIFSAAENTEMGPVLRIFGR